MSPKENPFYMAFVKNLILRKSCSECNYTNLNRISDITIGDFWKVKKYKRKLDDNKGVSFCLFNTNKGNYVFEKIKKDLKLCESVPIKYALKRNAVLREASKAHKNRDLFFYHYKENHVIEQIEKYLKDTRKYDGIISNLWYTPNNYGALLTAYAIQQIFRQRGLDYRLLNYNPYRYKKKYKNSYSKKFAEKYLNLTFEIKSLRDLKKFNSCTDTFVIGSDQVFRDWYLKKKYKISLLPFTDETKKRVAFSASFGKDSIDDSKKRILKYSKLLKRFDSVTVREISGVDLCQNILDVKAEHLLDPVFLLDLESFNKLIEYRHDNYKNKIVSYILDDSKELNNVINNIEIEAQTEVLNIANKNLSMTEFLLAIKDCDYFITYSFHGTCFALLYHTPFLALKNKSRGTARFDSLISTFNIKENFVDNIEDIRFDKIKNTNISWENIDIRIAKEKYKFELWYDEVFNKLKKTNITQEKNHQSSNFLIKLWKNLFS